MSKIYLKKGRGESLQRFHPWVFSGAIGNVVGDVAEGDVVSVWSSEGELLGCGLVFAAVIISQLPKKEKT